MDRIATWTSKDLEILFLDSAERLPHLAPALIEKDFWVCWLLRRIFLLDQEVPMIFKGGTSISKAYPIIRRFSEDIDLSLAREGFGYGDDEFNAATSNKASKALLQQLLQACVDYVDGPLRTALHDDIEEVLGPADADELRGWSLESQNGKSLRFVYPRTGVTLMRGSYVAPDVLLEFGARADHWPAEERLVSAYAAQAFPESFEVAEFPVRTLEIARTFWEKATILHSLAHGGPGKVNARMARHYYDLALLAEAPESSHAVRQVDLLEAVAQHKARFFPVAWASYDTARAGSLRLIPDQDVREKVERDYAAMAALFMEEPPTFAEILDRLAAVESAVNN